MPEARKEPVKPKRCSHCKRKKRDVRRRLDPFLEEVHGEKVYKNLCNACDEAISEDI
jgi:hypothetical protein